jgi:hypothetical protein
VTTALNLHKLMSSTSGYVHSLRVRDEDHRGLAAAREIIRSALRSAFRNWDQFVRRSELVEDVLAKSAAEIRLPTPKFRLQGSFDYHTANDCQQPPLQQVDMDDGVFLPQKFVFVGGKARPLIAARAYFALVERALKPVCEAHGWKLNPTTPPKGCCVRIELNRRLHIDLPLYAIQDSAFEILAEAAAATQLRKATEIRDSEILDEQVYRDLSEKEIILAHRRNGWVESDPRKLSHWFGVAVEHYGPVVRDLSRALKGLRDAKWTESELGSICIMAAVVDVLGTLEIDDSRFDVCLVDVARAVAARMGSPIENPVFPNEIYKNFCADWSPPFRASVQQLFRDASDRLSSAMNDTYHKDLAIARAREAFGSRVPTDESLVTIASVAAIVKQLPPQPQRKPMVPRTQSG